VGAVITAQPASPAPRAHIHQAGVPVVVSEAADQVLPLQVGSMRRAADSVAPTANLNVPSVAGISVAMPVIAIPTVTVPPLPVQVTVPALQVPVPTVHGLLGA
jgi:hypothetical protein